MEITCEICGTARTVYCSAARRAKYCSRTCYFASKTTRVQAECETCGGVFTTFPSKLAQGNGRYCSRQCCADTKRKGDAVKRNYAYASWRGMVKRCYDKNNPNYPRYGGRGILVCARWRNSFENFLADMGARPHGETLDRIDVNGPYSPANCRWASPLKQSRNKRNTIMVTCHGIEMPMAEYADLRGVRYNSLRMRIRSGLTPEAAADHLIRRGCTL